MMSQKTLYEVILRMSKDPVVGSCVRVALSELGILFSDIVEQEDRKCRRLSVFYPTVKSARQLQKKFLSLRIKGVKVLLRTHDQHDWETRWKKGWKPFALTPRVHVIPCFIENAKCPVGKTPFYLDTTAAFGTGLHETTRFSAQLIEMNQGKFKSFLDVGTGTGILVAVALFSGASYTEAFDIDADAVKVAQDNLKVNHLKCNVLATCDVKHYKVRRSFDLVAANLITHDLVAFRDKIISCVAPGGQLIISGISLKNMALVKKTYNKAVGLKCLKVTQGKEWSAFLFRKVS
ncbi:MAG: 50S ribosomal protein L11 methyltransferase [Candidatus Omnitrophica bacterium]|nr:50S ribosomal protein L11 methyltransferase [Candidatus Omnitrophota bacterium]